ncbi:MAG: diaminopimelate decarboxylase [Burkholderiales bacterium]|jgi:diaminopimelate decarboxylase|nr:diaminopimelate decarboxylase [Burkholderiales bacterium]
MKYFEIRHGVMHIEDIPLPDIAQRFGTPCYVYSRAALLAAANEYLQVFAGQNALICYAVKANSNLAVLNQFAKLGLGFDIVSGGELARVLVAGGDPTKIVFSGVGKTEAEIEAALRAGIKCFNVESAAELETLAAVAARLEKVAPISFRVNPDVDAKTHPYISTGLKENKFGIPLQDARAIYQRAQRLSSLRIVGIDMHIGSQITEITPFREAAQKLLQLVDALYKDGINLEHIDIGGGLGVRYRDENEPSVAEFAAMCREIFAARRTQLLLEPGRRLVAYAGILLTRLLYLKTGETHDFAITDAAMNDLMRPALYQAWHPIEKVETRVTDDTITRAWNIVGPVCESSDFFAHKRTMALRQGELLVIGAAGAYGMTMSSNYNSRPRICEIMVDGKTATIVRARENIDALFAGEFVLS